MTLIGMALTVDGGATSVEGEGRSIWSSSSIPSVFHPGPTRLRTALWSIM